MSGIYKNFFPAFLQFAGGGGIFLVITFCQNTYSQSPGIQDTSDCMFYDSTSHICWDHIITAVRFRKEPPGAQPPIVISVSKPSGKGKFNSPDVAIISNTSYTQSENSVFVNQTTLSRLNIENQHSHIIINSNNSISNIDINQGISFFMSTNLGKTWSGEVLGPGKVNSLLNLLDGDCTEILGDPACTIDNDENFYVNYVVECGQGISFSKDKGKTWSHNLVSQLGGDEILDKNHLWVDNSGNSAYNGNLYCSWTRFEFFTVPFPATPPPRHIYFVRSIDGGTTWSDTVNISSDVNAGALNQGVNIATGPAGQVYACWAIYDNYIIHPPPKEGISLDDEKAIGFAKNLSGGIVIPLESNGAGWHSKRAIDNIKGIRQNIGFDFRVNSFPSMAVNQQNGNIYIVWTNRGEPGINSGAPDIYLIKSSDEGDTWSSPVKVNQDSTNTSAKQWFPWISCDPVSGTLAVIFYDTRNAPNNDINLTETFVAISFDEGNTWNDFVVSDVAFKLAPIISTTKYAGDYIGISIYDSRIYPVWTDNRNGTLLTYTSPFNVITGNRFRSPLKVSSSSYTQNSLISENKTQYSANKIFFSNPVQTHIKIDYYLEGSSNVEIKIFDLEGKLVISKQFVNLSEGSHSDVMDISDLPNSLYMVNLSTSHYNITNKMAVIR